MSFPWPDGVVPVSVDVVTPDVQREHFRFGNLDAFGVFALVNLGADAQAGFRRGGSDEADDGGQTGQGFAAPVHADVGE